MSDLIDRRRALRALGLAALTGLVRPGAALAALDGGYVMWRDPGCGCCVEWGKRIEAAFGRKLPVVQVADMARIKRAQGVPQDLAACHTALIGGYVIEGHVPPEAIKRLIAARGGKIRGLAVPGMPAGSPGMDVGHDRKQPYQVIAFAADGRRSVFAQYR